MTKVEIIELYIRDLESKVGISPARNNRIKMLKDELKLALSICEVNRSLPSDIEIISEVEKVGMQKFLDDRGIYTSEKLHIDIYKHAFKKAQEPSDNG